MENSAEVPAGQRAGRDRKGKPQKGTDKQRGELAEMRFMLKAAGLGFGVAKPWGESERYDFVLDTGNGFVRVQVKSTYVARGHSLFGDMRGTARRARGRRTHLSRLISWSRILSRKMHGM